MFDFYNSLSASEKISFLGFAVSILAIIIAGISCYFSWKQFQLDEKNGESAIYCDYENSCNTRVLKFKKSGQIPISDIEIISTNSTFCIYKTKFFPNDSLLICECNLDSIGNSCLAKLEKQNNLMTFTFQVKYKVHKTKVERKIKVVARETIYDQNPNHKHFYIESIVYE